MNSNHYLLLDDGTKIEGKPFGADRSVAGEVVFNTAMTGYPESLTDPSYKGQILVLTFPLIGNYGVPRDRFEKGISRFFESDHVHITGLVISDYSVDYSHWNAMKSLSDWLREYNVPALSGIDTRALTKHLREKGSMLGKIISPAFGEIDFYDPNKDNLVASVSVPRPVVYPGNEETVIMVDCGVKNNILRCLIDLGVTVKRVPWDYDFTGEDFDGLVISNGPGDPSLCGITAEHIAATLEKDFPVFGICLGNQLLSMAGGASTYKLKYGHRGYNQPVLQVGTNKAFITSQNHGFAVDNQSLGKDWEPLFINLNDGTNEGIRHRSKPVFSTQFHPEASGGPNDTRFLFEDFHRLMEKNKKK
jgi:carbamoyl-phosphate synthase small subunit